MFPSADSGKMQTFVYEMVSYLNHSSPRKPHLTYAVLEKADISDQEKNSFSHIPCISVLRDWLINKVTPSP